MGAQLRLAFFYRDYLQPGAYPRDTKLLAEALAKRVEHVFVYCFCKSREDQGESTVGNLTTVSVYVPERLWTLNFVTVPSVLRARLLRNQDRVDLVTLIGGFVPENYPISRLLLETKLPYVVSPGEPINRYALYGRGLRWLRKRAYFSLFERRIIEGASAVQVCSRAHQAHHLELGLRVSPEKFFIGREAIDWEVLPVDHTEVVKRAMTSEVEAVTVPIFGYLGRLRVFHKGLDVLIRAWSLYQAFGGHGTLKIAGPGSELDRRTLRALCERFNARNIELLPPKYDTEKFEYLAGLSALVHPSRHDGITRVIREGLATGCVLITTYNTHIYELLEEHGGGYATAVDAFELALAMRKFADQEAEGLSRLREGARRVARSLNWEAGADQFLAGVNRAVFKASKAIDQQIA